MDSSSLLLLLRLPHQWSDLPLDLLELISNRLKDDASSSSHTVNLISLRSVCATWRLSLPLSNKYPKQVPFWSSSSSVFFILKQSIVYKIESRHNKTRFLVKLQETYPMKMQVLDLFSSDRLCFSPKNIPQSIDFHEFRVRSIRKAYRLEHANNNNGGETSRFWSLSSDKVVVLSSKEASFSSIMAIHSGGKLGFLRIGDEDERWRILDDSWNKIYEDIISYGGEESCVVVDDKGKTVIYDVGFEVKELADGLEGGGGHKKHLVEYSGEVLLVDKYVRHIWSEEKTESLSVEFRVYKLKREDKRWEVVRELRGDLALFIGEDCSFAVEIPARGLVGGCVYYRDYRNGGRIRGACSNGYGVFNVAKGDFVSSFY
ncbi:unnamed protein product [Cochlearia groenlandica]